MLGKSKIRLYSHLWVINYCKLGNEIANRFSKPIPDFQKCEFKISDSACKSSKWPSLLFDFLVTSTTTRRSVVDIRLVLSGATAWGSRCSGIQALMVEADFMFR